MDEIRAVQASGDRYPAVVWERRLHLSCVDNDIDDIMLCLTEIRKRKLNLAAAIFRNVLKYAAELDTIVHPLQRVQELALYAFDSIASVKLQQVTSDDQVMLRERMAGNATMAHTTAVYLAQLDLPLDVKLVTPLLQHDDKAIVADALQMVLEKRVALDADLTTAVVNTLETQSVSQSLLAKLLECLDLSEVSVLEKALSLVLDNKAFGLLPRLVDSPDFAQLMPKLSSAMALVLVDKLKETSISLIFELSEQLLTADSSHASAVLASLEARLPLRLNAATVEPAKALLEKLQSAGAQPSLRTSLWLITELMHAKQGNEAVAMLKQLLDRSQQAGTDDNARDNDNESAAERPTAVSHEEMGNANAPVAAASANSIFSPADQASVRDLALHLVDQLPNEVVLPLYEPLKACGLVTAPVQTAFDRILALSMPVEDLVALLADDTLPPERRQLYVDVVFRKRDAALPDLLAAPALSWTFAQLKNLLSKCTGRQVPVALALYNKIKEVHGDDNLAALGKAAYLEFDDLRRRKQKLCTQQPLCSLRNCRYHHFPDMKLFDFVFKALPVSASEHRVAVFEDLCQYGFPILSQAVQHILKPLTPEQADLEYQVCRAVVALDPERWRYHSNSPLKDGNVSLFARLAMERKDGDAIALLIKHMPEARHSVPSGTAEQWTAVLKAMLARELYSPCVVIVEREMANLSPDTLKMVVAELLKHLSGASTARLPLLVEKHHPGGVGLDVMDFERALDISLKRRLNDTARELVMAMAAKDMLLELNLLRRYLNSLAMGDHYDIATRQYRQAMQEAKFESPLKNKEPLVLDITGLLAGELRLSLDYCIDTELKSLPVDALTPMSVELHATERSSLSILPFEKWLETKLPRHLLDTVKFPRVPDTDNISITLPLPCVHALLGHPPPEPLPAAEEAVSDDDTAQPSANPGIEPISEPPARDLPPPRAGRHSPARRHTPPGRASSRFSNTSSTSRPDDRRGDHGRVGRNLADRFDRRPDRRDRDGGDRDRRPLGNEYGRRNGDWDRGRGPSSDGGRGPNSDGGRGPNSDGGRGRFDRGRDRPMARSGNRRDDGGRDLAPMARKNDRRDPELNRPHWQQAPQGRQPQSVHSSNESGSQRKPTPTNTPTPAPADEAASPTEVNPASSAPPPPPPPAAADATRAAFDEATLRKASKLDGGKQDSLKKKVVSDNIQSALKPKMKAAWKAQRFANKQDYKEMYKKVQKKVYKLGFELPGEALRTLVDETVDKYFEKHDKYDPAAPI
eukprot:TRINITY_DN11650_c0_g1_i3.p1 TRINITY_DN11650_c0_g1~~TRINITY_DN11650_c0_g1_i3.p1  ORF type:complete len:1471 (+),score=421.96 TRINITY_DN11650_c0_g1_i3:627-4415(+)